MAIFIIYKSKVMATLYLDFLRKIFLQVPKFVFKQSFHQDEIASDMKFHLQRKWVEAQCFAPAPDRKTLPQATKWKHKTKEENKIQTISLL